MLLRSWTKSKALASSSNDPCAPPLSSCVRSARSEMMDGGYDIQSFGTQLSSMAEHNAVGAKVLPGRNETLAFVKAHSDGESDGYLTGMCLFVERWLQHVFLCPFSFDASFLGRIYTIQRHRGATSIHRTCGLF